jgi:hypothetical protein
MCRTMIDVFLHILLDLMLVYLIGHIRACFTSLGVLFLDMDTIRDNLP